MDSLNFDMEQSMRGKSEDMVRNYCSIVEDHIMPHLNGQPAQFASYDPHCKSPPHETLHDAVRNMHSIDVTAPVPLGEEEISFFFQNDQISVMQECSASSWGTTTFSKQSEKNFTSNKVSSTLYDLAEISVRDVNNDHVSPLDQISQVDELVYQDWADNRYYKDLDMMFSNSPMFDQQQRTVDNISQASSRSNIVCSSFGTLKLGSHSTSRKLGITNAIPNQKSANNDPLSKDCLVPLDLGKDHCLNGQLRSSANDAENRTESEEKINEKFKGLDWQFSAEENINGRPSEVLDSQSNWHNIRPHGVPMDYNFPIPRTQLAHLQSSIESENDNDPSLSHETLAHATSCSWQYTDLSPNPMEEKVQKQAHRKPSYMDAANAYFFHEPFQKCPSGHVGDCNVGTAKMNRLGCEMETSILSEASFSASTLSDDDLLAVVQLQDVLCQLNHNAKLCVRDGLHRMARRIEKRNCFMNSYHRTADYTLRQGANDIELPEADTNLIDRSVALLLFQNASRPDTNCATPNKFHDSFQAMSAMLCSSESFQR